jgi:hypothetical protein
MLSRRNPTKARRKFCSNAIWFRVNCCSSSPAQSFLVPNPVGLIVIFYSLTTHCGSRLRACLLHCCWPSPAQWFLVPTPMGLMTIFYCLTALWAFIPHESYVKFPGLNTRRCGEKPAPSHLSCVMDHISGPIEGIIVIITWLMNYICQYVRKKNARGE